MDYTNKFNHYIDRYPQPETSKRVVQFAKIQTEKSDTSVAVKTTKTKSAQTSKTKE